jgi:DNA-binding transcriptional MerR regulator
MLHIGELAGLAGVSTRAVRHYHHRGLLPEPVRTANGYRSYGVRALSRLIQIRRLSSLGLSLGEIADALDAGSGPDMREVLLELDAELAARETELRQRRSVIARLLEQGDDPTLSPELAAAVRDLGLTPLEVDSLRAAELALPDVVESYRAGVTPDPTERAYAALFAEVDDVHADDPRVEPIARRLHPLLSDLLARTEPAADNRPPSAELLRFGDMMLADLSGGQRRAMELLVEFHQEAD